MNDIIPQTRTPWTLEEIEILKTHFSTTSTEDLYSLLPLRNMESIRSKAKKLGLHKSKEYRLAYLKENRANAIEVLKGREPWNKRESIRKICEICKEEFDVEPNRKNTAICCSVKCLNKWKKTIKGTNHPLYKEPIQRICKWCGQPFECKPSIAAMGQGLYCSRNCLGSAVTQQQGGKRSSIEIAVEQVLISLNKTFEPQKQVGRWLVDFYLPDLNLVIECDGKYWHSLPEVAKRDQKKDHWLQENGYNLLRLGEDAIKSNAMKVVIEGLAHYTNASIN